MVEYVEEDILSFFFSRQFMDVIYNKHINHLVEMQKVICIIVSDRFNKLRLKFIRIDIKNSFFRKSFLYFNSNGMRKVGFSQSGFPINKQGIKGGSTWFVGNSLSCRSGQPVAFPFNKIRKRVIRIKPRIYVEFFYSRDHKGVFN